MSETVISVFGLGKVGLPLACAFLDAGYKVIGVDKNPEVVEKLNQGASHIDEPGVDEILKRAVSNGMFTATVDGAWASQNSNFKIVAVPLILTGNGQPDFTYLLEATESIAEGLKRGDVYVTETTLPPGTTSKILVPILEKTGLKAGRDFYVSHAPERVMSGRVLEDFKTYPKIIGGVNIESAIKTKEVYEKVFTKGIIIVRDCKTAEAVKVFEGIYRDVNIALANELALVCEQIGIDFWDVRLAANTQPYCHIHEAGAGVGGHCIPVYPHFIISQAETKLIKMAREINSSMPEKLALRTLELSRKIGLDNPVVGVLGLAFRPGVKEHRYSPTLALISRLKALGLRVYCNDPLYTDEEIEKITGVEGARLEPLLRRADVIVLVTAHKDFKDVEIPQNVKLIVDGRALWRGRSFKQKYYCIGIGDSGG